MAPAQYHTYPQRRQSIDDVMQTVDGSTNPSFDSHTYQSSDAGNIIDFSREAFSNASRAGSHASLANRQRLGITELDGHRPASIDESEATSPTSSKGAGLKSLDGNAHANHIKGEDGHNDGEGKAPAWTELKTKAGKERKRLPLACIACRRKKIRCSGEKPACKHCVRSRIPCVYKITTRKAAPRTDYMTMLDKRLKRMEERVIRIIPDPNPERMACIGRASVKPVGGQAPKSAGAKKRAAEDAFAHEIDEWSQGNALTDKSRPGPRVDQGENGLLRDGAESLPLMDLQEHLAETFFDNVYGQSYHLLHKPSFMRRLK